jgi:hypothetical protein
MNNNTQNVQSNKTVPPVPRRPRESEDPGNLISFNSTPVILN